MRTVRLFLFLIAIGASAADRQVAITIDDLPRGGDRGPRTLPEVERMTRRLLTPFRDGRIPVIGFVNEGHAVDLGPGGLRRILDLWLDAGADLGNHGYNHLNLNEVPLADYTADIVKGEPVLRAALRARGKRLTYYRHPFLFTGPTPEMKSGLARFLQEHQYVVAPVTLDNDDYEYAALYNQPGLRGKVLAEYLPYMESVAAAFEKMSVQLVGREFPQVLLIHASQLNADTMPDLLAMFRRRGYRFVTLGEALRDPVYRLPEEAAVRGGWSWIHRWAKTKGVKVTPEPDPPEWVQKGFESSK